MSGRHRSSERWEGDDGLLSPRALPADWWGPSEWGPPGYEFDAPRRPAPARPRYTPAQAGSAGRYPAAPVPPEFYGPWHEFRAPYYPGPRYPGPRYPGPRGYDGLHGADPVFPRLAPVPPGPAAERPAASLFRQVLVAMRGRNLITGLVLPITVAIAIGIAVVVAAGVNNGSGGIAAAQLPAGFPPARAATGDFTVAPAVAGHGAGPAAGVAVNAIAASGGMQVAAGSANGMLALWSSADGGSTWARGTGATARVLTAAGTVSDVAHGRAGWVAVGGPAAAGASPGTATPAPGHPVVLGSAGGRTWTAEGAAAAFTGSGLVTSSVAAGTSGYVIVGWRQRGGHQAGRAWFSARLAGWRPAVLSLTGGDSKLASVTSARSGFVAVGSAGASPAAWISPNGKAWRQVTLPLPASARAASLRYVAAAGGTVAAVGSAVTGAGGEIPFGAISGDGGATWHESALPAPVSGPASLTISALAAAGHGYTATGTFGAAGGQDVVIWTSGPGSSGWTAAAPAGYGLSGAGAQAITALAAAGSTLTGAGFTVTGGTETPTIWQSPIRS